MEEETDNITSLPRALQEYASSSDEASAVLKCNACKNFCSSCEKLDSSDFGDDGRYFILIYDNSIHANKKWYICCLCDTRTNEFKRLRAHCQTSKHKLSLPTNNTTTTSEPTAVQQEEQSFGTDNFDRVVTSVTSPNTTSPVPFSPTNTTNNDLKSDNNYQYPYCDDPYRKYPVLSKVMAHLEEAKTSELETVMGEGNERMVTFWGNELSTPKGFKGGSLCALVGKAFGGDCFPHYSTFTSFPEAKFQFKDFIQMTDLSRKQAERHVSIVNSLLKDSGMENALLQTTVLPRGKDVTKIYGPVGGKDCIWNCLPIPNVKEICRL